MGKINGVVLFLGFWLLYLLVFFARLITPLLKFFIKGFIIRNSLLFLDVFPFDSSSGHKYRVSLWKDELEEIGYYIKIKTLIKRSSIFFEFVKPENLSCFFLFTSWKRFFQIFHSLRYNVVVVRREILLFNDYGNLFMENLLLISHPNVILDFDDDIGSSKKEPRNMTSQYGRLLLENGNKFNDSLRLYKRFIVASNYLKEKVLKENPEVKPDDILVIPTCVDYDRYDPKIYQIEKEEILFGWIGGNHNYYLLESILPAFEKISMEFKIKLVVIGGKPFSTDKKIEINFIPWSMESEVESLKKVDVGLMPLFDDDVCRGKGGFKLIQYMGLGFVSLATGLTINNEIVDDGENGFLVPPGADWYPYLKKVILAQADFARIGAYARQKIMESYTFSSNAKKYIDFIKRS